MKTIFLATGIGSMPFTDVEQAVDVSLAKVANAPFWPQLPQMSFTELMVHQFCEGFPCIEIDREKERIYFNTAGDRSRDLAGFNEKYDAAMNPERGDGNLAFMAITPEFSKGIYAMEQRLLSLKRKLPFVKVQVTGPFTFTFSLVDENKRAIYFNEKFRDVATKALAMKCRWQIQKFQPFAERVLCFIDEPILSALGSSTFGILKREEVVSRLTDLIAAIHADRAIAGVHCCGGADWSSLVDAGADIINFDAYSYGDSVTLYPDAIQRHLRHGGMLAYGIIPTSKAVRDENPKSMEDRLEKLIDQLACKGIDRKLLIEQSILTPACGTGLLEAEDALRVFDLLGRLSEAMREKYL
jgi:hypothetical protein